MQTEEDEEKQVELEYVDNDEFGGEVACVNLGFSLGQRFASFEEFNVKFKEACEAHYVRFSRRDSRSIEAARRKVNRSFKPELEYYYLRYSCFFSFRNKSKGTGKRKRQSLTRKVIVACPASLALRTTDDGKCLEIFDVENFHNHPVSEEEYKQFLPKQTRPLTTHTDIKNLIITEESTEHDKYKAVLTKGKKIAKLASVSDLPQVKEILKNLDDFIFYLKHTAAKADDDDKEKMETDIHKAKECETLIIVNESK